MVEAGKISEMLENNAIVQTGDYWLGRTVINF